MLDQSKNITLHFQIAFRSRKLLLPSKYASIEIHHANSLRVGSHIGFCSTHTQSVRSRLFYQVAYSTDVVHERHEKQFDVHDADSKRQCLRYPLSFWGMPPLPAPLYTSVCVSWMEHRYPTWAGWKVEQRSSRASLPYEVNWKLSSITGDVSKPILIEF
jgi:hypothetical protein